MSAIPTFHAEVILECQNELGEGIVWDAKTQLLHWVDLHNAELHTLEPKTKKYAVDKYPESPFLTFFAPRASSPGFVGTLASSLSVLPPATTPTSTTVPAVRTERKSESVISAPLDSKAASEGTVRFNDGGIDPEGRIIYGSMGLGGDEKTKRGELWRFDPQSKEETKIFDGVGCSNGLGWSPDGRTVYYIDSSLDQVSAFTYTSSGEFESKRTLVASAPPPDETRGTEGVYDGLCIDGLGNIWAGRWRDERIIGISPEGKIFAQITVKGAKSPTIPCFGGANLDTMYIATAASHLGGEGDKTKYPHSGDLYAIDFGPGSEIRKILGEEWKGAERHRAAI